MEEPRNKSLRMLKEREEGIPDMLYLRLLIRILQYADQIESKFAFPSLRHQPLCRSLDHMILFGGCDEFHWLSKSLTAAGFDFDEDHLVSIQCDDIQFLATASPVPGQNSHSLANEVLDGMIFAPLANLHFLHAFKRRWTKDYV